MMITENYAVEGFMVVSRCVRKIRIGGESCDRQLVAARPRTQSGAGWGAGVAELVWVCLAPSDQTYSPTWGRHGSCSWQNQTSSGRTRAPVGLGHRHVQL